jgi:sphingomyelin phosphodiesterase 2
VTARDLTVVTLNTLGLPAPVPLAQRYAAIGAALDAGDADVACFQEVITWRHLRLLARRMPSFGPPRYRRSPSGPAGGIVTFSRRPVSGTAYRRFGFPPSCPGVPASLRLRAAMKGILVTRLADPALSVITTHPLANWDGDWSPANRFHPVHRAQLGTLARLVGDTAGPAVLCGDFNIARDSSLFTDFVRDTGLSDAFGGTCPPTFRAEFLPPGAEQHCIDFILTTNTVQATAAELVFAGQEPFPGGPGYISDHIGLSATLSLTQATQEVSDGYTSG